MKIKNLTFKFNLYYIFLVSILIPFLIGSILFTIYYIHIIKEQNNQNTANILNSISHNIESQITELNNIATTCYMHSNILASMESFNNPELYSYYDSLQLNHLENDYTDAMTKLMFTAQNSLYNICFFPISEKSDYFYSLSKSFAGVKSIRFKNYHEQDWFQAAIHNEGDLYLYPNHIPYYLEAESTPAVFSAIKLIINMDSKKPIGVLKIDSKLSNLEELLNSIEIGSNSHLFLVDESGHIITSTQTFLKELPSAYTTHTVEINGTTYKSRYKNIPNTTWNLVYLTSSSYLIFCSILGVSIASIGMIIGIALAFLVYRYRTHTLVSSIKAITDTITKIEHGNLEVRSYVNTNNELKIISEALNKMAYKLNLHIQKEYIAVINQQKAEYKALQSQINPHFLYNTLNGFIALNRMGEKKKLEKSIINLTHLFRYTCHPKETTVLSDELNFIKEYLDLQKLKYDDRLEFVFQVDPHCLDLELPKLLLQPIVENSIIHGLEPTAKTIQINISCNEIEIKGIGYAIAILITDNGVGYDASHTVSHSTGIGSKNVEARISLFNKDALYYCHSTPHVGTETLLLFPKNNCEERNHESWLF